MNPNDPKLRSFVTVAKDSHFPIQNLPYGVFVTPANYTPRIGVAIGDYVLDLAVVEQAGLVEVVPGEKLFNRATLNPFIERGPDAWRRAREAICELLRQENARLRDDARLRARALVPQSAARMLMPARIMTASWLVKFWISRAPGPKLMLRLKLAAFRADDAGASDRI